MEFPLPPKSRLLVANRSSKRVEFSRDPWVKDDAKFVIISFLHPEEYEHTVVNGNRKVHGTLLKVRGFARDELEVDMFVREIMTHDPVFDVQVIPVGEWRPLENGVDDLSDTVFSNELAQEILGKYVENEQARGREIRDFDIKQRAFENGGSALPDNEFTRGLMINAPPGGRLLLGRNT